MKFSTLAILFATAGMLGLSTAQGQYRFSGHTRRPVAQRRAGPAAGGPGQWLRQRRPELRLRALLRGRADLRSRTEL